MSRSHLAVTTISPACELRDGLQVVCVISDNLSRSATSGAEARGFQPMLPGRASDCSAAEVPAGAAEGFSSAFTVVSEQFLLRAVAARC